MTRKKAGQDHSVGDCVEAIRVAFDAATGVIRSDPDAQHGFEQASELAQFLRELADQGAVVRADAVARIYHEEQLSLKGLAEKIGVSKGRADQILKAASGQTTQKEPKK